MPIDLWKTASGRSVFNGYLVAIASVTASLAARTLLESIGHFYYLPYVPAVMLTATLASRGPTALAIALAIAANVALTQRAGPVDTTINAALFVAVCWLIAEICWRLRATRSRAEALSRNLARRNQMLDAILCSVPVVTLNDQGHIRFLTSKAALVLGGKDADIVGRSLGDFVEGFSLSAVTPDHDTVWTGRRPDGKTYPLGIQLSLMPDQSEGDHATLCLTDLSHAHAADARARELHAQLNRVWRLNSLGEMAASLAHELNQPLSAAVNYLHAGRATLDKADIIGQSAVPTLDMAKAQLLRAGQIIRRMRELLAHETRSLNAERVSVMMADMQGVIGMIQRNGDILVETDIDDDDWVRAERIQFQQAIINLIRNATEALQGRADGRVRIVGRTHSDALYQVRVEDNGPGIVPEQLETIFRPLTTTKSSGMGLGLSVTRTIVESHGGTLSVETSDMGGAAFSFCLMREREMEDA